MRRGLRLALALLAAVPVEVTAPVPLQSELADITVGVLHRHFPGDGP